MKKNIMPTVVLGSICLIVALMLSLINSITAPIIEQAQNAAANEALLVVLPDGKDFEEITLDETYPASITKGYRADGGFVFQATVTGKSTGLIVLVGINAEGKIVGTKVIADQETDTYDVNVFPVVEGTAGAYAGMDLEGFAPYLVSGATLTSSAYGEAVKAGMIEKINAYLDEAEKAVDAADAWVVANGEYVRSEEFAEAYVKAS
jgi:hypothetical protein